MADPTGSDQGYLEFGNEIDGNVAVLDLTAEVHGVDTFLEVGSSILTVEDALSTITSEIVAAVG
jgi:hypothetical protein